MSGRINWQSTLINDPRFCELMFAVAPFNDNLCLLRLPTKTNNSMVYNYVDEARQNGNGVMFEYGQNRQSDAFVDEIMENISNELITIINHHKTNDNYTRNLAPEFKDCLSKIVRVHPKALVIVGQSNNIVVDLEAAMEEQDNS